MDKKIHIICGPTASGKSRYAVDLAQTINGCIINADSMQIYKHLHIITAQPDADDKALIPHRLYGHVECGADYSIGIWLQQVQNAINQALAEGKVPIVVGGTGMYINGLVNGISKIPEISPEIKNMMRNTQAEQPIESLHQRLMQCDPVLAARLHQTDAQRITRGLEVYHQTGIPLSQWQKNKSLIYPPGQFHLTLINPPRDQLYNNCNQRFLIMLENGLLEEVRYIMGHYDEDCLPKAIGLREMISHLKGLMTLEDAIASSQQLTRNYAKRQVTWFKNQLDCDVTIATT